MVGLDLGQANDFSALAVVERVRLLPPGMSAEFYLRRIETGQGRAIRLVDELRVRHLQRWELGTRYDAVVDDVAALMGSDELEDAWLYLDGTGVSRGVADMFREAYTQGRMGAHWPLPITITGAGSGRVSSVPKRDLLTALQLPLQQGRLKIAAGLPMGEALERELTSFRMKLTAAGRDTYQIQRRDGEGHGDLVIAVALAAFRANWTVRPPLVEVPGRVGWL